jgi:hypothetical protein
MRYFVEDLQAMALDQRDPFALFVNEKVNRVPNNVRTVDDAWIINVHPSTEPRDIPDHVQYYTSKDTRDCVLRNIYAVQLDGLLRTPKGSATFTIYWIVNRKDPRFFIVQNEGGDITYHVSEHGECRVTTLNQARDPLTYIVAQSDNGIYQLAEVMDFDARQPIEKDRIVEIEARYPLTNFDPDYGDQF